MNYTDYILIFLISGFAIFGFLVTVLWIINGFLTRRARRRDKCLPSWEDPLGQKRGGE